MLLVRSTGDTFVHWVRQMHLSIADLYREVDQGNL